VSLAFTTWTLLAAPLFDHYGWGYWIYYFITQSNALIAAGLAIARWFVSYKPVGAGTNPVEAPPATEA
jgi:hypothetical protein